MKRKPSSQYWPAIRVSLVLQAASGVLSALVLDGGTLMQIWAMALAAYWVGVLVILTRRPAKPTRLDLFLVRWAFPLLLVLAVPLSAAIWKARGLLP